MPALTDYFHDGDEKLNRKGNKILTKAKEDAIKAKETSLEEKQRKHLHPDNEDLWEDI